MIVSIIPARGGSKGIKLKNLKSVCSKELIYWSIQQSRNSKLVQKTIVSTDHLEIAKVAKGYGAEVHHRSPELATDESKTIDLLFHLAQENPEYKTFVVLQPTSPIRDDDAIDKNLTLFSEKDCDTLVTGHMCKYMEYGIHNNLRRQDIEGFFYDDGNIYIIDREVILQKRWSGDKVYRVNNDEEQNLEIDTDLDLFIVSSVLEKRIKEKRQTK